ncbi:MAG TPA: BamA/TamA family outer membrane protein [Armatimonadota bacterium]|nr:BamA/TamA family outer membrane protein [Armatimonadota bacterium]
MAEHSADPGTERGLPRFRLCAGLLCLATVMCSGAHAQYKPVIRAILFDIKPYQQVTRQALENVIRVKVGDEYDQARAEAARIAILDTGWFQRDPELSYVETEPMGNDVALVFHLTENPIIKSINFEGNTVVDSEVLRKQLATVIEPDKVLNLKILDQQVPAEIRQVYTNMGYSALMLHPTVSPEGVLTIPLVEQYVEDVRIQGLKKTKEKVVRREIHTRPGQLLNAKTIQDDLNRLYNLDVFDTPPEIVDWLPGQELGGVIPVFQFTERKTGYFTVGVGFSTAEGFLGYAEAAETNLRGRGQKVSLRAEFGNYINFSFRYLEPYLDSHHTSLEVNLFRNSLRSGSSILGGSLHMSAESSTGVIVSLNRPLDDDYKRRVELAYSNVTTQNYDPRLINVVSPFLLRGQVGSLRVGLTNDTRDIYENPRRGGLHTASLEYADRWLGGASRFSKFEVDLRQYFSSGDKGVFALRGNYGSALGSEPPVYEAFRVGGADTVRGYLEDRWYGMNRLLVSAEYRYQISGHSARSGIQLVLFADYGDAYGGRWASQDGSILFAEHQTFQGSLGYGLGVRVNTPLGPIRLDYGIGSEGGRTHFGISQTF